MDDGIKKNNGICFKEDGHIYYHENNDKLKFISVTTLIGKYENEFDKDFWSGYKALERILNKADFNILKKQLLDSKKIDLKYILEVCDYITETDYNNAQQTVLDEWQQKNFESCERGTKIHAKMEHLYTDREETDLQRFKLGGTFKVKTNEQLEERNQSLLDIEKGVFPEYLIYRISDDEKFCLAGQIDLLIKDGNDILIIDYKGLPLDTKIPTPDGWSTIKDLKEGDKVFDKDGKVTTIVHKSDVHYNPCYKIIFDNGDEIIADHEHRWDVSFFREGHKYTHKVMTTEEIANYLNGIKKRNGYNIPKILNASPLQLDEKELPIDPYVLGVWLGDGSKSCGIITQQKGSKVWDEIIKRGYKLGDNAQHNINRQNVELRTIYGLQTKLRELNLLDNKHIPDLYQRASYKQRLDLLRGLMDTDGYFHKKRKRFVMETGQKWQRDDFVKLLSTFGIKTTEFEVYSSCNGKKFKAYDVCFTTKLFNPFLTRNQDILPGERDSNTFRNIKAVEKFDTVPTQCLEVDSETHTFLCTEKMIVTHNTNRELKESSHFDTRTKKHTMMKYPLNNIMDCNKMHYALQLSTYAWMLQKINPDFNIKLLKLIHYDHDGNVTEHEVPYLKKEVIKMCKDYKKQLLLKEKADKRKPIEF